MPLKNSNRWAHRTRASIGLGGSMLLAGGLVVFYVLDAHVSVQHPEQRIGVSAANVLRADRLVATEDAVAPYDPDAAEAYETARTIPHILDGLHCYCDCARMHGHRSLLTCFESDHGAKCWVCVREAVLAGELHSQGATLDEIRGAIDAEFSG